MDLIPTLSSKLRTQQHIFLSLLLLVLNFIHTLTAAELTVSFDSGLFIEQESCTGRILKPDCCQNAVPALRSLVDCAAVCAGSSECATFLWDGEHDTCRLCNTLPAHDCSNTEVNRWVKSFEKQGACGSGGTAAADGTCQCIGPYGGDKCIIRMKDCTDWREVDSNDGVRYIYPDLAPAPFQTYCRPSHKRTYISSHTRASWNFTRGWNEYRDGFGELNPSIGDHWLGLNNIHALTHSRVYRLTLEIYLTNNAYSQRHYNDFKVSDESSNYALSFSATVGQSSTPSLGDCLTDVMGKPFSTYDADHDDVTENCAQRHQSGWWFGNCTLCNPNGVLMKPADGILSGAPEEVFWYPGFGNRAPLKVYMFLR